MSNGPGSEAAKTKRSPADAMLTMLQQLTEQPASARMAANQARRHASTLLPANRDPAGSRQDDNESRRAWLRARSGAAQMLLLQLAAVIAVSAIVVPHLVRVQRSVADLTAEARALEVTVAERQRLNAAVGALARNVTVTPRCANPPSNPSLLPSPPIPPVESKDCAVWDPAPRRPTLWEQSGRANTLAGDSPEKELCFVADAQAGNDSPSTSNRGRWRSVLKCIEWHRPAVYGYADSTANSDSPGTLVIADYPQTASFDPAVPEFESCTTPSSTSGCNRAVFDSVAAFRAYWLSSDGEWLHQPQRLPVGVTGTVISTSDKDTPHSGTEIVRMLLYVCPQNPYRTRTPDRAVVNHGGVDIALGGASACTRALLTNDPQAFGQPDWNPAHPDWASFGSVPDELEDDLAGPGATDVWRFELAF